MEQALNLALPSSSSIVELTGEGVVPNLFLVSLQTSDKHEHQIDFAESARDNPIVRSITCQSVCELNGGSAEDTSLIEVVEEEFTDDEHDEVLEEDVRKPTTITIRDNTFLVFKDYKSFDQSFKQYQKESQSSFCTAHCTKDFSKFVLLVDILKQTREESKQAGNKALPFIRWEYQSDGLALPFIGYPFISLGHTKYVCSQGKDLNLSSKEKLRQEKLKKQKLGIAVQTRNLVRPTKKMGCPVVACCKKVYAFPNMRISKDTKRNRSTLSLKLRKLFLEILAKVDSGTSPLEPKSLGSLMYVTKFPNSSQHRYHIEFACSVLTENNLPASTEMNLGARFSSLKDLENALNRYRSERNCRMYCPAAELVRNAGSPLVYSVLTYRCFYGVKTKMLDSTGTFKQGCEMHIRFGVSEDGSQLVVKSMSEEHNHEINEESVVKEALHPELCSFVSKLVWSDVNISIDDVKKQLEAHVCEVMFKDQVPPPRTRRQYFPSKKQIRYFVVKAKASLNISQEAEMKLSAQAERLQEAHGDEKMIFNFKVKHLVNPMDLSAVNPGESATGEGDEEFLKHDIQVDSQGNPEENAKVLFCHQTLHQQRLLKRYSSQVIVTQINDIYSKIPFPLFCLYVQSSVDFQLVGVFILQNGSAEMIVEGLQIIKDWNPGWSPKFVTVDYNECQIAAVESSFPGAFLLISDASREQAWIDWLSQEENEVFEHKDEVMKYLQAIASSYSEDTLNAAARELEESDVWKLSDKMRNWFQLHWLSQAKRWVAGYRPDDYLLTRHTNRCMEDEAKVFKSIKLVNKSSPLQDVIQQIVEHVVPVNKKQYEMLNLESFNMQNELFYLHPGLPNYLSCRPGKLTSHIYERVKLASEHNYVLSFLHPGIFSVQGSNNEDDLLHTVTFGDSTSFPSCDCHDWQQYKLPCVHFCAVFSNYPGWTWDMLTCSYKNASVFTIDWGAVQQDRAREVPGFRSDNSTQTTGSTLLGGPGLTDIGKYSRMSNDTRVIETSQVLATQCRSLLQQISKLQLAHHSRESLYRLKTDLKELLSVFSTGPKHKNVLSSPGLSGSFVVQSRTGKPRKGSISSLNSSQSIFQQYNIKPITPKELVIIKGDTAANNSVSSTPGRAVDGRGGEDEKSVFSVDPSQVLLANAKEISKEMSVVSRSLKRPAVSPASVMSHNLKREKVAEEGDPDEDNNELKSVVLEFPEEDTGEFEDNEQILNPVTTVTTIIDGQTVNIPLDQVSVVMTDLNGDNVEASIVYGDTSHESDVGQITSENNSLEETIVK